MLRDWPFLKLLDHARAIGAISEAQCIDSQPSVLAKDDVIYRVSTSGTANAAGPSNTATQKRQPSEKTLKGWSMLKLLDHAQASGAITDEQHEASEPPLLTKSDLVYRCMATAAQSASLKEKLHSLCCSTTGNGAACSCKKKNVTQSALNSVAKERLLRSMLEEKLITQDQYRLSLPYFVHVLKCYLWTILDSRLRHVMETYVRWTSRLLARGSLMLNMYAIDHQGSEHLLHELHNASFVTHMFVPERFVDIEDKQARTEFLQTTDAAVKQWLDRRFPDRLARLMDGVDGAAPLEKDGALINQTMNAAHRMFKGHLKVHVAYHLPTRIEALFLARHRGEQDKRALAAAAKALLDNTAETSLADRPTWRDAVRAFREEFGMGNIVFKKRTMDSRADENVDRTEEEEEDDEVEDSMLMDEPPDAAAFAEEEDDEEAEAASFSLVRSLWPIHCRVLKALVEERQRQWELPRELRPKKLIRTATLLPLFSYKRSYVQIDNKVMFLLAKAHNAAAKKNSERVPLGEMGEALQACLSWKQAKQKKDQAAKKTRAHNKAALKKQAHGKLHRQASKGRECLIPKGALLTSFRTDGVGCSLCYEVQAPPLRVLDKLDAAVAHFKRNGAAGLGGVDPGDVFTATVSAKFLPKDAVSGDKLWSKEGSDGRDACSGRTTGLSRKTYYSRTLINKFREEEKELRKQDQGYRDACGRLARAGTWKTVIAQDFMRMCEALCRGAPDLRRTGIDNVRRAKAKMLVWRRKRSLLDQFAHRAVRMVVQQAENAGGAKPDGVYMAYGNGSTVTRSGPCVPKAALRAALKRALKTMAKNRGIEAYLVLMDEFRTSMLCHVCHQEMKKRWKRMPGRGKMAEDRSVRECTTCGSDASPTLRSRDGNAADNMLYKLWMQLAGKELPAAFQRVQRQRA